MAHRMPRYSNRIRGREKYCAYCEQWREKEEYTSHPVTRDGLDNRCNWCRQRLKRERRERKRAMSA